MFEEPLSGYTVQDLIVLIATLKQHRKQEKSHWDIRYKGCDIPRIEKKRSEVEEKSKTVV
jgi:hypothetical protein